MKILLHNIFKIKLRYFLFIFFINCIIPEFIIAGKGKPKMFNYVINQRIYGDLRNSSQSDFVPVFHGKIVWEKETAVLGVEKQGVSSISVIKNVLIVKNFDQSITAFNSDDGSAVWNRRFTYSSSFTIVDTMILCMNELGSASLLKTDNTFSKKINLPLLISGKLAFLDVRKNETFYVLNNDPINQDVDPIKGPGRYVNPSVTFALIDNKTEDVLFDKEEPDSYLTDIVYSESEKCYYACVNYFVVKVPFVPAKNSDLKKMSFEPTYQMSLSTVGQLATVNKIDNKIVLQMHDQSHKKTLWQCDLPGTIITQPPSITSEQSVYLIIDDQLVCIDDNGQIQWQDTLPCKNGDAFFTVTKNNLILVAAGHALLLYSTTGEIEKSLYFETYLTSRPVIDSEGTIYVGGVNRIFCIK